MDLLRVLLVASVFLFVVSAEYGGYRKPDVKALYFSTNYPAGGSIVSLKISTDGKLSSPKLTPTGGKGLLGLSSSGPNEPLEPHGPDALFGQGSVVVDGNFLFVVNAGSNTLSLFLIDENDPTHLTLIGKPAHTLGEFPTSVAYSSKLKTACVLNGGRKNGVTCFWVDTVKGLIVQDKHPRSISPELFQSTPPIGPLDTASTIVFNPSSTALFVLGKGNLKPAPPGYIFTWKVVNGKVSWEPAAIYLDTLPSPFSLTFAYDDDSTAFLSDATIGGAVLTISPSPEFKITIKKLIEIPYNLATCWSSYSPVTNAVYFTDAFTPNITVVSVKSESISATIDFPYLASPETDFATALSPLYGGFDTVSNGNYLYVLAGTAHVYVIDILAKKAVHGIDLSAIGDRKPWVGMAIYS